MKEGRKDGKIARGKEEKRNEGMKPGREKEERRRERRHERK